MLRFNNKGNTQNNTVRFGLFSHLRFPRTVKHQQNKRLKRYCPWHRVENFFLASLPHVSWRLKVSLRKGPSSSAVLICFEESRHCPCKKCFSHLETNAWSPANTSTLTVKHLEPVQESGTLPRDSEHSTGDQLAETHRQAPVQKQQYWNAALGNSFFFCRHTTHTHTHLLQSGQQTAALHLRQVRWGVCFLGTSMRHRLRSSSQGSSKFLQDKTTAVNVSVLNLKYLGKTFPCRK